jgi:hypothetical protein
MRLRSRRGLTMLEVVVATVILVAIVGMVFVVMSGASNQTTKETANMMMQEKAAKLLEEIAAELRMAKADTIQPVGAPIPNITFVDAAINQATPINPVSGPPFDTVVSTSARTPLHSGSPALAPNYKRYEGITFKTMPTDSMKTVGVNKVPVNDFDFVSKKPVYSRTVVYQVAPELPNAGATAEDVVTPDGKDNNQNVLIDERRLMRQEYRNNPAPAPLPAATAIARNLRAVAFELPDAPTVPERVILHVVFQDVDVKGQLIWYYTTTSVTTRN